MSCPARPWKPGSPQPGSGIPVDGMLNFGSLSREGLGDAFKVFLAVSLQGSDDGIAVPHRVGGNMGQIGGAQCVFRVHDAQVLVDLAQGLAAVPAEACDQEADEELGSAWFGNRYAVKKSHRGFLVSQE